MVSKGDEIMAVKHHHKTRHPQYDLYGDLERIKEAIFDTSSDVKGKAGEMISNTAEDFKDKTLYARDNVANYTAERPFKSLGIALLAGLVVGYFIRK